MTWQQEYAEVCEVINQTDISQLKRSRLKKDLKSVIKNAKEIDYNLYPPDFRWNLCAARLRLGRFDNWDGWEYRSDWAMTYRSFNGYTFDLPRWDGQDCEKLVILGEQGVGDELLFASAIPELIVRLGHEKLEFQTYPKLIPMFERSFRIKCTPRQRLGELEYEEGTYVVALADLFMFYRRDKKHFPGKPYLKPDPSLVNKWKVVLDGIPNRKIGIGWKARHGDLSPADLMCEDATYINLQYLSHPKGEWIEDLPEGIVDLGIDPLGDMENHLALISCLDKVVTVTQTTVHEAGGLGKECHAIRPKRGTGEVHNSLWYYFLGNLQSPVYNSVRIYNTPKDYQRAISHDARRPEQLS